MHAETFSSGEAYLELIATSTSFNADCLILDLQMPGMSGLDLQSLLAGSGLPIIFITAHDELSSREEALKAGAVAFLRKPFDDEILMKTIREALSHGAPDTMGNTSS
jgi:FixJ family two-component response regulator